MKKSTGFTYAFVVTIAALALYLIFSPGMKFKPHWDEYPEAVCHIGRSCELTGNASGIWSDENIARYNYPTGVGFKLKLTKVLPSGKEAGTKTFELKRWEAYQEEHNNNDRAQYVTRKQVEFQKYISWWKSPDVDHHKLLLATDVTGKIDQKEAEFIRRNLYDLKLEESVTAGDSLDLTTCLVTEDPEAPCDRLRISDNQKARAAEVKPKLEAIQMQTPAPRERTALYERLRSIFAELNRSGSMPEEVYIYTDGMEFSNGVDFYHKHITLLMHTNDKGEHDKWGELAKLVEPDGKKWVDLKGTNFTIFRPHREMSPAETKEVDSALAFMVKFLTDHNAKANIVIE